MANARRPSRSLSKWNSRFRSEGEQCAKGKLSRSIPQSRDMSDDLDTVFTSWVNYNRVPITAALINNILSSADDGWPCDQAALIQTIMQKDPTILAHIQTRINVVLASKWTVLDDEEGETPAAKEVKKILSRAGIVGAMRHLLDAIPTGYSGVIIDWAPGAGSISGFTPVHPANWVFDAEGNPAIVNDTGIEKGLNEFHANQFAFHKHSSMPGIPAIGGLVRSLVWTFFFKHYGMKHRARYLEKFGIPFLIAKISDADFANDTTRASLLSTLRSIGADGAGVFTKESSIETVQAGAAGANASYQEWFNYLDQIITILVLGQLASSDKATGMSNGQTQDKVRQDLFGSDCQNLMETVQNQILAPLEWYKYRTDKLRFKIEFEPPEDLDKKIKWVSQLESSGRTVKRSWIEDTFNIPLEDDDSPEAKKKVANASPIPPEAMEDGQSAAIPPSSGGGLDLASMLAAGPGAGATPMSDMGYKKKAYFIKAFADAYVDDAVYNSDLPDDVKSQIIGQDDPIAVIDRIVSETNDPLVAQKLSGIKDEASAQSLFAVSESQTTEESYPVATDTAAPSTASESVIPDTSLVEPVEKPQTVEPIQEKPQGQTEVPVAAQSEVDAGDLNRGDLRRLNDSFESALIKIISDIDASMLEKGEVPPVDVLVDTAIAKAKADGAPEFPAGMVDQLRSFASRETQSAMNNNVVYARAKEIGDTISGDPLASGYSAARSIYNTEGMSKEQQSKAVELIASILEKKAEEAAINAPNTFLGKLGASAKGSMMSIGKTILRAAGEMPLREYDNAIAQLEAADRASNIVDKAKIHLKGTVAGAFRVSPIGAFLKAFGLAEGDRESQEKKNEIAKAEASINAGLGEIAEKGKGERGNWSDNWAEKAVLGAADMSGYVAAGAVQALVPEAWMPMMVMYSNDAFTNIKDQLVSGGMDANKAEGLAIIPSVISGALMARFSALLARGTGEEALKAISEKGIKEAAALYAKHYLASGADAIATGALDTALQQVFIPEVARIIDGHYHDEGFAENAAKWISGQMDMAPAVAVMHTASSGAHTLPVLSKRIRSGVSSMKSGGLPEYEAERLDAIFGKGFTESLEGEKSVALSRDITNYMSQHGATDEEIAGVLTPFLNGDAKGSIKKLHEFAGFDSSHLEPAFKVEENQQSPIDKKRGIAITRMRTILDNIGKGNFNADRIPEGVSQEAHRSAEGVRLQEAAEIARAGSYPVSRGSREPGRGEGRGTDYYERLRERLTQDEGAILREWAKRKNLMLSDEEFNRNWHDGEQLGGGESSVYFDPKTQRWFKRNNLEYGIDYVEFFNRLTLHNHYFPETAYRFEGFVDHDTGFGRMLMPVVSQADTGGRKATIPEIRKYMKDRGFLEIKSKDGAVIGYKDPENGVIFQDIHSNNAHAIDTPNGPLVKVFDPQIRLDDKTKNDRVGAYAKARLAKLEEDAARGTISNIINSVSRYADIRRNEDGSYVLKGRNNGAEITVKVGDIGNIDASWSKANKTITMSRSSDGSKFTHELTHAMRDLEVINDAEWSSLTVEANKRYSRNDIKEKYKKAGFDLSESDLDHEVVAKMLEDYSAGKVEVYDKGLKGIMQRAVDFVKDLSASVGVGTKSMSGLMSEISSGKVLERNARTTIGLDNKQYPGVRFSVSRSVLDAASNPSEAMKSFVDDMESASEMTSAFNKWLDARSAGFKTNNMASMQEFLDANPLEKKKFAELSQKYNSDTIDANGKLIPTSMETLTTNTSKMSMYEEIRDSEFLRKNYISDEAITRMLEAEKPKDIESAIEKAKHLAVEYGITEAEDLKTTKSTFSAIKQKRNAIVRKLLLDRASRDGIDLPPRKAKGSLDSLAEYITEQENIHTQMFSGFHRTFNQLIIDRMNPADREKMRSEFYETVKKAYMEHKGNRAIEFDFLFTEDVPDKKLNTADERDGYDKKHIEKVYKTGDLAQSPLKKADKTIGAINTNVACPMFVIGNSACWLNACYLTTMGRAAGGLNYYEHAIYTGEILQLSNHVIKRLNKIGGLRINGLGDFTPSQEAQLRDIIRDAKERGLQLKLISKQADSIRALQKIHDSGVPIDHIQAQPSMDYLWIPVDVDIATPDSGVMKTIFAGAGKTMSVDEAMLYAQEHPEAVTEAYKEQYGREAKIVDGRLMRKYGFSRAQVDELISQNPDVKILPRWVVTTPQEIAEAAMRDPGTVYTFMHGKVDERIVSEFPGGGFLNFGTNRHYITKDGISGSKHGQKNDAEQNVYAKLNEYLKSNYSIEDQKVILKTLKDGLCCQENSSANACAGCASNCAMCRILADRTGAKPSSPEKEVGGVLGPTDGSKGIDNGEVVRASVPDTKVAPEISDVFDLETDLPSVDDMIMKPEYFLEKKGRRADIVYMSPDDYVSTVRKTMIANGERMPYVEDKKVSEYAKEMSKLKNGEGGKKFNALWVDMDSGNQEGLHRAEAAKKAGMEKVPVVVTKSVRYSIPDSRVTPEQDAEYMAAVEKGDTATAQIVSRLSSDYDSAVKSKDTQAAQRIVDSVLESRGIKPIRIGDSVEPGIWYRGDAGLRRGKRSEGLINLTTSPDEAAQYVRGGVDPDEESAIRYYDSGEYHQDMSKVDAYNPQVRNPLVVDDAGLKVVAGLSSWGDEYANMIISDAKNRLKNNYGTMYWWENTKPHTQKAWANVIIPQLKKLGYDSVYYTEDSGNKTLGVFDKSQLGERMDIAQSGKPIVEDASGRPLTLEERFGKDLSKFESEVEAFSEDPRNTRVAFEAASEADQKKMEAEIERLFGPDILSLHVVPEIMDNILAVGRYFDKNILIKKDQRNPWRTMDHEVLHAVESLFLSPAERRRMRELIPDAEDRARSYENLMNGIRNPESLPLKVWHQVRTMAMKVVDELYRLFGMEREVSSLRDLAYRINSGYYKKYGDYALKSSDTLARIRKAMADGVLSDDEIRGITPKLYKLVSEEEMVKLYGEDEPYATALEFIDKYFRPQDAFPFPKPDPDSKEPPPRKTAMGIVEDILNYYWGENGLPLHGKAQQLHDLSEGMAYSYARDAVLAAAKRFIDRESKNGRLPQDGDIDGIRKLGANFKGYAGRAVNNAYTDLLRMSSEKAKREVSANKKANEGDEDSSEIGELLGYKNKDKDSEEASIAEAEEELPDIGEENNVDGLGEKTESEDVDLPPESIDETLRGSELSDKHKSILKKADIIVDALDDASLNNVKNQKALRAITAMFLSPETLRPFIWGEGINYTKLAKALKVHAGKIDKTTVAAYVDLAKLIIYTKAGLTAKDLMRYGHVIEERILPEGQALRAKEAKTPAEDVEGVGQSKSDDSLRMMNETVDRAEARKRKTRKKKAAVEEEPPKVEQPPIEAEKPITPEDIPSDMEITRVAEGPKGKFEIKQNAKESLRSTDDMLTKFKSVLDCLKSA